MSEDIKPARNSVFRCSFCAKTQMQVRKIIAGPEVNICNECVLLCVEVLLMPDCLPFPTSPEEEGASA